MMLLITMNLIVMLTLIYDSNNYDIHSAQQLTTNIAKNAAPNIIHVQRLEMFLLGTLWSCI